ncbi:hypothetical protein [Microcoleus sp. LEGE 07076]|uniref:hypothetical protein n=1 Tax=Microcoleus sp. LEGE 07076 TaxID=915322 RepID=UPI001D14BC5D|nr:hypothetical protein [Microcoleus sp. LEGE 07076]
MKAANKQLAEWDTELNQLHTRNGDLDLKVQMLEQELREVKGDRYEKKTQLRPDQNFQSLPSYSIS